MKCKKILTFLLIQANGSGPGVGCHFRAKITASCFLGPRGLKMGANSPATAIEVKKARGNSGNFKRRADVHVVMRSGRWRPFEGICEVLVGFSPDPDFSWLDFAGFLRNVAGSANKDVAR